MLPAAQHQPRPGRLARSAWNRNARSGRLYENRATLQAALAILEGDLDHHTDTKSPDRFDAIKRIRVTQSLLTTVNRQIAALEGRA